MNGKMHAPITPRPSRLILFDLFALYAEWSLFYKAVACIPDDVNRPLKPDLALPNNTTGRIDPRQPCCGMTVSPLKRRFESETLTSIRIDRIFLI